MNKNYKFTFKKSNDGFIFGISDYESIPCILVKGAIALGGFAYAYIKFKPFF